MCANEEILKKLNISVIQGGKIDSEPSKKVLVQRSKIEECLMKSPNIEMIVQLSKISNDILYEYADSIDVEAFERQMMEIESVRNTVEVSDDIYCHFYSYESNEKKYDILTSYVKPALDGITNLSESGYLISTFDRMIHFHCVKLAEDKYRFHSYITFTDRDNKFTKNVLSGLNMLFTYMTKSNLIQNQRLNILDHFESVLEHESMYTCAYSFDCIHKSFDIK